MYETRGRLVVHKGNDLRLSQSMYQWCYGVYFAVRWSVDALAMCLWYFDYVLVAFWWCMCSGDVGDALMQVYWTLSMCWLCWLCCSSGDSVMCVFGDDLLAISAGAGAGGCLAAMRWWCFGYALVRFSGCVGDLLLTFGYALVTLWWCVARCRVWCVCTANDILSAFWCERVVLIKPGA